MKGKELAAALRAGQRVYGTCVLSPSPAWPPMLAGVGMDFAFIDTEHVSLARETLSWMCRAFDAHGIAPIVRIPEPDPYRACMVLDGGAHGVIAPYVESVEQVIALRGAVKLRPLKGERLRGFLAGTDPLNPQTVDYLVQRNTDRVMVVNIESIPAMNALDDILRVPGVDALLVGPHDLSINLGIPEQYDNPVFLDAISTIIRKARAAHVGIGIHYSEAIEPEIAWAREGANFIVHSSDFAIVQQTLRADFQRFRKELQDAPARGRDQGSGEVI